MREKRRLTQNEKQMFLDLKPNDITKSLLEDLFADTYDASKDVIVPSKYNTFDEFTLNKGEYPTIEKSIVTNCGLFIVNKFLYEEDWIDIIGYNNEPITDGKKMEINRLLVLFVADNDDEQGTITQKYINYQNKITWLELTFHTQICSTLSINISKPNKKVQERKKQLIEKNKDALASGDVVTAVKIQDDLVKLAKEEMKNDPAIELYDSGARGSFDNAYRQEHLIKGPIYNAANERFEIMTNSLYDGAEKKDLIGFANAVVDGLYPKSIGTAVAGYDTKKIVATLQSEVLGEKDSDCGSKFPLTVKLTKKNISLYMYHYIVEGSKFVRLDSSTKDKYIGKTVKMRLPSTCCSPFICNRCAGDRFYILNIKNIGLTGDRAANSMLNMKMKASHDTTMKMASLDMDDLFIPFKE